MKYKIVYASEYEDWYAGQPIKSALQIGYRLDSIKINGHFGDHRYLDENVWELRWRNGRRIYFAHTAAQEILLLIGGNKNGQTKDIRKAKNVLRKRMYLLSFDTRYCKEYKPFEYILNRGKYIRCHQRMLTGK